MWLEVGIFCLCISVSNLFIMLSPLHAIFSRSGEKKVQNRKKRARDLYSVERKKKRRCSIQRVRGKYTWLVVLFGERH